MSVADPGGEPGGERRRFLPEPDAKSENAAARHLAIAKLDGRCADAVGTAMSFWPRPSRVLGPREMTPEEARRVLIQEQPRVRAVLEACALARCDFGLAGRELGPAAGDGGPVWQDLTGLMGPLRGQCRLLIADARRLAGDHEYGKAAERIRGTLVIARRVRDAHEYLIARFTADAMLALALDLLEETPLDEAGATVVLAELEKFDAADPSGFLEGIRLEGTRGIERMKALLEQGKVGEIERDVSVAEVLLTMRRGGDMQKLLREPHVPRPLDTKAAARALEEAPGLLEELAASWADPAKLKGVIERIEAEPTGVTNAALANPGSIADQRAMLVEQVREVKGRRAR